MVIFEASQNGQKSSTFWGTFPSGIRRLLVSFVCHFLSFGGLKMGTFVGHVPLRFTPIYGVIFWSFLIPPKMVKKAARFGARSPQVSVVFCCHFFAIFCHLPSRAFFRCIRFFFSFFFLFFLFFFSFFSPFFSPTYARARAVHRNPLATLGGIYIIRREATFFEILLIYYKKIFRGGRPTDRPARESFGRVVCKTCTHIL